MYLSSWDLATPGSPIKRTLISPRIFIPSSVVRVTPPRCERGFQGVISERSRDSQRDSQREILKEIKREHTNKLKEKGLLDIGVTVNLRSEGFGQAIIDIIIASELLDFSLNVTLDGGVVAMTVDMVNVMNIKVSIGDQTST